MDQAKCSGSTEKVVQLACCYERTYVMPGRGHNLHGVKLKLIQNLHNHRVERKPYAIVKGHLIDHNTLLGWFIYRGICLTDYKTISRGKKIFFLQGRSFQGRRDVRVKKVRARLVLRVRARWGPG